MDSAVGQQPFGGARPSGTNVKLEVHNYTQVTQPTVIGAILF